MEKWSEHKINAIFELSALESFCIASLYGLIWGRYHEELSSQLTTLNNQIFLVKNSNLWSSVLVANKSSVIKTRQIWSVLSSHLGFWVSFNLLPPKSPVNPALTSSMKFNFFDLSELYMCIAWFSQKCLTNTNTLIAGVIIISCKKKGKIKDLLETAQSLFWILKTLTLGLIKDWWQTY